MRELGSRLMRAREARGLTLEDAERDTRISRRYLQALETEQFEAIPAPVYARGFLRSYSQYLGLDAQEMLGLFPRDEADSGPPPQPRASVREPLSAVGPARPTWQKPAPPQRGQERNERGPQRDPDQPYEPVIGVDIGVPSPARRIQTDPAAQARTTTVIVVAVVGVLIMVMLAFVISRAGDGGGDATPTPASTGTSSGSLFPSGSATAAAAAATQAAGATGKMPDVHNLTLAQARAAIQAAAPQVQIREIHSSNAAPKNTVWDQSPAPESPLLPGTQVTLAVSDGPQ